MGYIWYADDALCMIMTGLAMIALSHMMFIQIVFQYVIHDHCGIMGIQSTFYIL